MKSNLSQLLNKYGRTLSTHIDNPWGLALITLCWGCFLYFYGLAITGPFIFGDEFEYFVFARSIFHGDSLAQYTQYGPLYPALISLLFFFKSILNTYQAVRIFNIILFLSTTIPAYFLAKELFTNRWLRALLVYCLVFTPFSGFVKLVWAEPLYLPLFYWTLFLLCLSIKKPALTTSLLLGVLLSSLYYTKPGAGLVVQIAAFITLFIHAFTTQNLSSIKPKLYAALVLVTCFIIELPWFLHYIHLGLSIIGYGSATQDLTWRELHQGYLAIALNIFLSLFYQFSYFFIGTWGMFGMLLTFIALQWRHLNCKERYVVLFVILCSLGLIALSAIGMASYLSADIKLPNGRYFSILLPLLTTLSLYFFLEKKSAGKHYVTIMLTALLVTAIIAIIASPLYSRSPQAFISMPELSSFIYISDGGSIVWRPMIDKPDILLRIGVIIFFSLFAFGVIWLRKWRHVITVAALVVFIGALFSTYTEQSYINRTGSSQSGYNDIYYYFIENNINIAKVRFDEKLASGNAQYLTLFWMDASPIYLKVSKAIKKNNIAKKFYFLSQDKLALHTLFSSHGYIIYTH